MTSKLTFPRKRKPTYTLKLPWPPSINRYYGVTKAGRRFINKEGQEFRKVVVEALRGIPEFGGTLTERLQVWVDAYPPDKRRRDLDNLGKALFDSMTHAGVYEDDCLIDDVRIVRREVVKGGYVLVYVAAL